MGAYDAIKAVASQPISNAVGLSLNADYKREQAMKTAAETSRKIGESVEAYQERMKQFYLEQAKKIKEENTTVAEKKYKEIQNLNLFKTNDPFALKWGQSQIESLNIFLAFNQTNPIDVTAIKAQQRAVETRLYNMKNGKETEYNTTTTGGSQLYNGEWQGVGQRDFLS